MSKDKVDYFLDQQDTPEKLDNLFDKISQRRKLSDYAQDKDQRTTIKLLSDYDKEAQELLKHHGEVIGVKSGYNSIDDLTKGFKPGDLTILAGQPSHGKTVVGNNIAYRVAKEGVPVLFVSLEMTQARIDARILDIARRDNSDEYKKYLFVQEAPTLASKDTPMLLKKAIEEHGVELVIIDHLHFLADRQARDIRLEVGTITQNLKNLAKEMNIPILLLCQVSRLTDEKQKPRNSNLKESGYIEQDADIILMVWRDISIDSENPNEVEVYCTKNRDNGFTEDRIKHFYQEGSLLTEYGKALIHRDEYVNPFDD